MKRLHRNPYTIDGFKKLKMPKDLYEKILTWYFENKENALVEVECNKNLLGIENVNKEIPSTKIIHINQDRILTHEFNKIMLEKVKRWSGVDELIHTSTYGIRIYERGDTLISHIDHPETHILSVICSIHQEEMDEPWALEIKDVNGDEHEVYLEEGEMLFYESDILEHGRMKPLNGNRYSNMYVHFKPKDYKYESNVRLTSMI